MLLARTPHRIASQIVALEWDGGGDHASNGDDMLCSTRHGRTFILCTPCQACGCARCRKYIFSGHYLVFICPKSALHDRRTTGGLRTAHINTRHTHNTHACASACTGTVSILCVRTRTLAQIRGQLQPTKNTHAQASLTHINVQFNYSAIYLYLHARLASFAEFRSQAASPLV